MAYILNDNVRITDIQRATVNGRKCKLFTVWHRVGDGAFVHVGRYSAPVRTANKNLINAANDYHRGA